MQILERACEASTVHVFDLPALPGLPAPANLDIPVDRNEGPESCFTFFQVDRMNRTSWHESTASVDPKRFNFLRCRAASHSDAATTSDIRTVGSVILLG